MSFFTDTEENREVFQLHMFYTKKIVTTQNTLQMISYVSVWGQMYMKVKPDDFLLHTECVCTF